ncbi:MAG: DUF2249 domain-containing protein [Jatrophihabitantaceae bacterium]
MSPATTDAADLLDVREVSKPQRHPLIFGRFAGLAVGESFVLVNSHDPKHLRQEFERDHAGAFGWDYVDSGVLESDGRVWRVRISRAATVPTPQELCNVQELLAGDHDADPMGAVWKLPVTERHLDANVIRVEANGQIASHVGPDLDVLMLVVAGSGTIMTDAAPLAVTSGSLIWLPRRSRRAIGAGEQGLAYLTVHPRRPALQIGTVRQ